MSLLIKIMLVQLLLLLVLVIASCRAWTLPSSSTTTSAAASTKNNNVRIRQNHHVFNTIRVNKNINRSSVIKKKSSTQQSMTTVLLNEEYSSMMMMTQQDFSPFLVTALAIFLGVSAQTFINQMLEGDQGLGAFLKDGSGYNKSGFRQSSSSSSPGATASTTNNNKPEDPLPWLKLPKLVSFFFVKSLLGFFCLFAFLILSPY